MKGRKSESLVSDPSGGRSSSTSSGSATGRCDREAAGPAAWSRRAASSLSARFSRDQRWRKPGGSAKLVLLLDGSHGGCVPLAPALLERLVDVMAGDVGLHPVGHQIGQFHLPNHDGPPVLIVLRLLRADADLD